MKRNLIISALLAHVGAGVVALSTVLAFLISMGVLAISDRFGRRD